MLFYKFQFDVLLKSSLTFYIFCCFINFIVRSVKIPGCNCGLSISQLHSQVYTHIGFHVFLMNRSFYHYEMPFFISGNIPFSSSFSYATFLLGIYIASLLFSIFLWCIRTHFLETACSWVLIFSNFLFSNNYKFTGSYK